MPAWRSPCALSLVSSTRRSKGPVRNQPANKRMSTAVLLGYDPQQPSFRHRMGSLVATLEGAGWRVRVERFPSGRYGLRTWERRVLLREADVVVLHQIKLSAME